MIANEVDILLISPERFANQHFRSEVLARIAALISLLVIDEAHCISDWGHDFRPNYRLIEQIAKTMPANLRLIATTATANDRVTADLTSILGSRLHVSRGDLNRTSLSLQTIRMAGQAERLAWLAEQIAKLPGHGIVFTLTKRDANRVADWLKSRGLKVEAYTADLAEHRAILEQALLGNRIKALVATVALGMGFDKPDLAFVLHYQMPGSVVAYYQQVGRAGRALTTARGVLLSGQEDADIANWFITSAFPTRGEVGHILEALEASPAGLSIAELLGRVNLSELRIKKIVELLSLEQPSPIARQETKWQLTASRLGEEFWARVGRLTALRRAEYQQMERYLQQPFGNHMRFLIQALDGDPETATVPRLPPLSPCVDAGLVQEATAFLRRTGLSFEPRKRWPAEGLPLYDVRGRIASALQARPGMMLCEWGDAGWGALVKDGKYTNGYFADELVAACVAMIGRWTPQPAPAWVTCIPSLRHPDLVPSFARRLAAALGLPFLLALETSGRPEQKTMANASQQARNLDGSLVLNGSLPHGPVLLVDDMVDSRWTLTVAAWLLRKAGSGDVWPVALARTGHDD